MDKALRLRAGGGKPLALCLQTDHMGQNGKNHSVEVCKTLDVASQTPAVFGVVDDATPKVSEGNEATHTLRARRKGGGTTDYVAFAQNNRMEVRLIGGEGDHVGALAARPDFGKGQGGSLICMASGQANAEISGGGDPSPALMARQYKDPPFLVHQTGKTFSRHSARQTGRSNSSTINQSTEGDLSSTDGSPFDSPILIDRAAFNQDINAKYPPHIEKTETCDTLTAQGPHAIAYQTEKT